MAIKISVKQAPKPFPQPTLSNVVVLQHKRKHKQVLVLLCPTPRGNYCLFVGDGTNTYLPADDWGTYTPAQYDLVHEGPIDSMEVTFNA